MRTLQDVVRRCAQSVVIETVHISILNLQLCAKSKPVLNNLL